MKKPPSKIAHNQPKMFFSVLRSCLKPAQSSISIPLKLLTAQLMYTDFAHDSGHVSNFERMGKFVKICNDSRKWREKFLCRWRHCINHKFSKR